MGSYLNADSKTKPGNRIEKGFIPKGGNKTDTLREWDNVICGKQTIMHSEEHTANIKSLLKVWKKFIFIGNFFEICAYKGL